MTLYDSKDSFARVPDPRRAPNCCANSSNARVAPTQPGRWVWLLGVLLFNPLESRAEVGPSPKPTANITTVAGDVLAGDIKRIANDVLVADTAFGELTLKTGLISEWARADETEAPATVSLVEGKGEVARTSKRYRSAPDAWDFSSPGALAEVKGAGAIRGRFSLWFWDSMRLAKGEKFAICLQFGAGSTDEVKIDLGFASPAITMTLPEKSELRGLPIPRSAGWRRLEVRYAPYALSIALDDASLLATSRNGFSRPLEKVLILRTGSKQDDLEALVDDVQFWSATGLTRKPSRATEGWEVTDVFGDRWFGQGWTDDGKDFKLSNGANQEQTWATRAHLFFPLPASEQVTAAPPIVWSGAIGWLSLTDGSKILVEKTTMDPRKWTVRSPILGPLTIAAGRVAGWTPSPFRRRVQEQAGPFHLGAKRVADFQRPNANGARWSLRGKELFKHFTNVNDISLVVRARGLEPAGPNSPYQSAFEKGFLRTDVYVNQRRIGDLNSQTPEPDGRLRIPLAGLNAAVDLIEFRQNPDPITGAFDEVELSEVALEWVGAKPEESLRE